MIPACLVWMSVVLVGAQEPPEARTLRYANLVDRLTALDRLILPPPPGLTCRQFSSYDRRAVIDPATGEPKDWDANDDRGHYLREDPEGHVMAEMDGPGCIVRIWSANPKGDLLFFIDRRPEPQWRVAFEDLVQGKVQGFSPPLVGVHGRGANSYVPIPYQDHCRVVATAGDLYYHVDYVTFPEGWKVPWFSLPLDTADLESTWVAAGLLADYEAVNREAKLWKDTQSGQLTVPPGDSQSVIQLDGPTVIKSFRLKLTGPDVAARTELLRKTVLQITWDDASRPAVLAPVGDFFGTGPGLNPYRSVPMGTDGDWFYSNWLMPFRSSARIELRNYSDQPAEIQWEIGSNPLQEETGPFLYFRARWRRSFPNEVFDWPILECEGAGRYVGCALSVWNSSTQWWGEGDEKIYVDGETFPSWFGTGTEDYFGDAWGFRPFQHAMHNCTRQDGPGHGQYTSVNRWHLTDAIPFQRSFRMTLENYAKSNEYAAVAYWYASPESTDSFEPIRPEELTVRPWQRVDETEVEEIAVLSYDVRSQPGAPASETQPAGRWRLTDSASPEPMLSAGSTLTVRCNGEEPVALPLRIEPGGPVWLRFRGESRGSWSVAVEAVPGVGTSDGPTSVPFVSDGDFIFVGPFDAAPGTNRLVFEPKGDQAEPRELLLDTVVIDRADKGAMLEAEKLEPSVVDGGGGVSVTPETFGLSGWRALALDTPREGTFELPVPVEGEGDFRVSGRLAVTPPDASCVFSSGARTGAAIEGTADAVDLSQRELIHAPAEAGVVPIRIHLAAGAAATADPPRLVIDSLSIENTPIRLDGAIEFEDMKVLIHTPALRLERRSGTAQSGRSYLAGEADGPGEAATFEIEVETTGRYRGMLHTVRAPDHGGLRVLLDDTAIVGQFDAFVAEAGPAAIEWGPMDLMAGRHRLTVIVTGRNVASSGHTFDLDCLVLKPDGGAASP